MEEINTNRYERRRFPRLSFREPVQYELKDSHRFGGCLAGDLSEGGIRINFNDFIPLKTKMVVQVFLAMGRMVECTGHVVWVQKFPFSDRYQAGLEFADSDSGSEAKKEISRFVSHASQK